MGTRHLIEVKLDGELKIAQYGQWDGYLTGQGIGIANFIHEDMNKDEFKKALKECSFMNEERIDELDQLGTWKETHPWLSRDLGSDILKAVQDGARELISEEDFKNDELMCEFYYLIDMDNETVSVNDAFTLKFDQFTEDKLKELDDIEE